MRSPIIILQLDDVRHAEDWGSWSPATAEEFRYQLDAKQYVFEHPGHVYRFVQHTDFDCRFPDQKVAEGGSVEKGVRGWTSPRADRG
jgi:hypothetical protein